MSKVFGDIARRLVREGGLSRATSFRIVTKLNTMAKSVEWATPIGDGRVFHKAATPRGRDKKNGITRFRVHAKKYRAKAARKQSKK